MPSALQGWAGRYTVRDSQKKQNEAEFRIKSRYCGNNTVARHDVVLAQIVAYAGYAGASHLSLQYFLLGGELPGEASSATGSTRASQLSQSPLHGNGKTMT